MKCESFYGRGKLLLFGEYFILDGVRGIALPTRLGQSLNISYCEKSKHPLLQWNSFDNRKKCWFRGKYELEKLELVDTPPGREALYLQKLLRQSRQKNARFLTNGQNVRVETKLEFSRQWGLGSSSTLISLIARWAKVCPLELAFKTTTGSGYDIACAQSDGPIIYRRPRWRRIAFNPSFKDSLFFIPLGKKASSVQSIERYKRLAPFPAQILEKADQLTTALLASGDLPEFQKTLSACESFVAKHLNLTTVKKRLFPDFDGAIKSLGGWGGDCVMAASSIPRRVITEYFAKRGYPHCIPWQEMVFSS